MSKRKERSMIKYPGLFEIGLNLPVLVGDDDFIEHLHEHGFSETIDIGDLALEWADWARENVNE
jgi:hypothetical protein